MMLSNSLRCLLLYVIVVGRPSPFEHVLRTGRILKAIYVQLLIILSPLELSIAITFSVTISLFLSETEFNSGCTGD